MKKPGDPPFAHMSGLPSRDDADLQMLMKTIESLPRGNVEALVRNFYRAALGYERTDDPSYLAYLGEDTLVTTRLRGDPEYQKALAEAPAEPSKREESVDVEEMLARHGL